MKRRQVAFLFLAVILAACGLGDSPERGAREWFEGLTKLDGARVTERTCRAYQQNIQTTGYLLSSMNMFAQGLTGNQGQNSSLDLSGLRFTTTTQSGQTAEVQLGGNMVSQMMGFSQSIPIQATILMQNEDGKWKYCGER